MSLEPPTSITHHRSYFTCTLGEAQILNKTLGPIPYETINEFIDYLADKYGDTTAVACASPRENKDWKVEALSFTELRDLSITLSIQLLELLDCQEPQQTVACYASSSLSYLVHLLACLRAGWKVALISTACSVDAVRHLLQACKAIAVLCDEKHDKLIDQVLAKEANSHLMHVEKIALRHSSIDQFRRLKTDTCQPSIVLPSDPNEVVLYGHSSGTSTGLPKPIPITHQDEIGALPRFHQLTGFERPESTLSTTPIYTGGLADLWRSWSAGTTLWTYPENQAPTTAENILKYKLAVDKWLVGRSEIASPIGYISCVPYITQMMAEDPQLIDWLRSMNMVGVGGAAMPTSLGDRLVQNGVNLVSRFGSRECGFLLSSDRDYAYDQDWQYLRHDPDVKSIVFKKWNDTDYELIVAETWPSLSPAIRGQLPFNSHDVFIPHETIKNAWKYNGRSDVQITLTTGKKFDPSGIESALTASEWIKDAVVIGNDRLLPSAIIFSSTHAEALKEHERDAKIWRTITNMNESCPSHARLKRDMIAILPSYESSKIQKSSKGTIMRGEFDEDFRDIIRNLYEETTKQLSDPTLNTLSEDQRIKDISTIVGKQLDSSPLSADASFYEAGIDSTMSIQIRRQIQARLPEDLKNKIPMNVVYNTGNIRALSDFVARLRGNSTKRDLEVVDPNDDNCEMDQLLDRILKNEAQFTTRLTALDGNGNSVDPEPATGNVVLLTGATGFLGAHILANLANDDNVRTVICLVRKNPKGKHEMEARERVKEVLASYNLSVPTTSSNKIECLYSTSHEPGLELRAQNVQHIVSHITHVIHAAWAVNFSLPLSAFSSQLQGLLNLYHLAKLAGGHGRHVKFTFVSSTAAVLSAEQPVAEVMSLNRKDSSATGYGRSKWAAEKLLFDLTDTAGGLSINILRVGQLTASSDTGAWNLREAWPLMFDAGFAVLGDHKKALLPDLSDIGAKDLDWLPVDIAARSVVEIAMGKHGSRSAKAPEIFHVLSNTTHTSTWGDVQNWLSDPVHINFKGQKQEVYVEFISLTQWLNLLEEIGQKGTKHLAMSLIPLWRSSWIADRSKSAGIHFCTDDAQKRSKTMEMLASKQAIITKEGFLKMLSWLLSYKHVDASCPQ